MRTLLDYKYQLRLEKRFEQLNPVHHGALGLFKRVERDKAMMLPFFMALILHAVLEREVRNAMTETKMLSEQPAIKYYPTKSICAFIA